MTEEKLKKIFKETHAEIYSPENRKKIEGQIKSAQGLGEKGVDDLALALATNSALDKGFMFRVLAKALCD